MMKNFIIILSISLFFISFSIIAKTNFVLLPERESTKIHFNNPNGTLVEESRVFTFQQGNNRIHLSWEGVDIDTESIRIRSLKDSNKLKFISISYPSNENAIIWEIYSKKVQQKRLRINYLIEGMDSLYNYKATVNNDESEIDIKSYSILRNFSGEDYNDLICSLGNKQQLSTSLKNNTTIRKLIDEKQNISIDKKLIWDSAKEISNPNKKDKTKGIPVKYVIKNNEKNNLEESPFYAAKFRIFKKESKNSTIFLGEDKIDFTPVNNKINLYIGNSRDVSVTKRRMKTRTTDEHRDDDGNLQVYDKICKDIIEIKNYKDEKINISVIDHIKGQWKELKFSHDYKQKNNSTLQFQIDIPAKGKETISMYYKISNIFAGKYRKYNRVIKR